MASAPFAPGGILVASPSVQVRDRVLQRLVERRGPVQVASGGAEARAKRLLDRLAETQPKLIEELTPKLLSLGEVQKVLQQLLREQVSIRDLSTILEALIETAAVSKNPVLLVEAVRQTLSRALVRPLLTPEGNLRVLALDRGLEEELSRAFDPPAASAASGTALQTPLALRLLECAAWSASKPTW